MTNGYGKHEEEELEIREKRESAGEDAKTTPPAAEVARPPKTDPRADRNNGQK